MTVGPFLKGQVALVTGGGRGLGRAYCLALAAAGASVAVVSRTESHVKETVAAVAAAGGKAHAYALDVTDTAGVARGVAAMEKELGPIALLVNAAGVAEPLGPLAECDADEWWRGVEVNAKGPYLTTRFVLPGMLARGAGRIVNVSSGVGTRGYDYLTSYSVGKTALIRLTECVASEVASRNVRVFSISPGMVRTDMNRLLVGHPKSAEWFPWAAETLAKGKDFPPEASTKLILRLASGEADALTGRHISVADDLDTLIARATDAVTQQALMLRLAPMK
ncbi:MAG TPA: SDR family oxidoreductase [Candidatus Eisenbacteria bacterium]|nr:SDR family oxidoreductase [Candidatus Eisenbacteria bacterium]